MSNISGELENSSEVIAVTSGVFPPGIEAKANKNKSSFVVLAKFGHEMTHDLRKALSLWLLSCGSERTRKSYDLTLCEVVRVLRFHTGMVGFETFLGGGALAYVSALREASNKKDSETKIANATATRKTSALNSFLKFAKFEQFIDRNPLESFKRPKVKKISKSDVMTSEQVRGLFAILENEKNDAELRKDAKEIREARFNETVFKTLLTVGMRISELVNLRVGDVELLPTAARLHLRAKGSEDHSPLVPREIGERLLALKQQSQSEGFLFEPSRERVTVEQKIGRELARLTAAIGIEKRITPHVLRATVATHLHNSGVPIGHIQSLLNHKDIGTTAIYIRKAEEMKESAAMNIIW